MATQMTLNDWEGDESEPSAIILETLPNPVIVLDIPNLDYYLLVNPATNTVQRIGWRDLALGYGVHAPIQLCEISERDA